MVDRSQDPCLKSSSTSSSLLCGTTGHLTNFAILLGGGGGSGKREDPCLAGELYIDGSFNTHMIILACVTGFVIIVWLVVAAFLMWTPIGNKVLYGNEGLRVRSARVAIYELDENDSGL